VAKVFEPPPPILLPGKIFIQTFTNNPQNILQPGVLCNKFKTIIQSVLEAAPYSYAEAVGEDLKEYFSEQWIGKEGSKPWLPPSPDITSLGFSLLDCVKQKLS
jgi:hypothetical protein